MTTKRRPTHATIPVSVKLDAGDRARLGSLATARKRSSHYLMREAVREYLTREEARESFLQEAEQAWLHYKKTGLHVTQAEMETWAASLGTRRPKRLPKCHK